MAHAFLPPSGASSWGHCSLWPTMNRRFPQPESAEAIEGTAAHWVAWEYLAGRRVELGAKTPNGTLVTEEMQEAGEFVADTITARTGSPEFAPGLTEQTIQCSAISPHSFGTPDHWAYKINLTHIEIFDFKFGHRYVDEFWNPQGLCYLAGALDYLSRLLGIEPATLEPVMTVSFTVIQPRCFYRGEPVRTHTFKLIETREHFNRLANMAEAALLSNPSATTNEYCGDCPGRHACSALQLACYTDAEYSNARTPLELAPAAAALELRFLMRALARLEARVDGLKEQTISNIRAGKDVPYFRAEPSYGRTGWKIPDTQVVALGQMYGHDLSKPGVITPKQAEKAGLPADVINSCTLTSSTGFRLVAENSTDAPRTFGALKGSETNGS